MPETMRVHNFPLPDEIFKKIPLPSIENLKPSASPNPVDIVFDDIIQKHRMVEQYPDGLDVGACKLIRTLIAKVIDKINTTGPESIPRISAATGLILSCPEWATYKSDPVVRLAVESSIVNIFWRYVPHENYIESAGDLMIKWKNFEKERSHWWRARKAVETDDHIRGKWDQLIRDLPALLNFYNCLNHAASLLERPTLKHTLHLAAMTSEGRVYENGQGRSIASECRHIMVRMRCGIPIKARPERKTDQIKPPVMLYPKVFPKANAAMSVRDASVTAAKRRESSSESSYADSSEISYADSSESRQQVSLKKARYEGQDGTASRSSVLQNPAVAEGYVRRSSVVQNPAVAEDYVPINKMHAPLSISSQDQKSQELSAIETLLNFSVEPPARAKKQIVSNRQMAVRAAAQANHGNLTNMHSNNRRSSSNSHAHVNDSNSFLDSTAAGDDIFENLSGLSKSGALAQPDLQARKSGEEWMHVIVDLEKDKRNPKSTRTYRDGAMFSGSINDPIHDPIKIITNTAAPLVSAQYAQVAKPNPEKQNYII